MAKGVVSPPDVSSRSQGLLNSSPNYANSPTALLDHEKELGNGELPIARHRSEIEGAIAENSVTILVAPTGSGKTTQVPQFAREMREFGKSMFDEIIVTQPRIVAARTVSQRVVDEVSGAKRTHKVGYYTSKERSDEAQRDQHIAFLTDGKAMAQLLHEGKYRKPRHKRLLIIDEVHEWNLNIEGLIAIARNKTDPHSVDYDPNLKVVVMSATMDGEKLRDYFHHRNRPTPPFVEVKVPTHKVERLVSPHSLANVALGLAHKTGRKVLAFCAGKREIKNLTAIVERKQSDGKGRPNPNQITVVPLHGQQSAKEQLPALQEYDKPIIVGTTPVAETSVTIADAVAVADSGEMRIDRVRYDLASTGSDSLCLELATQSNLRQRAGRIGRTQPGIYVLCSPDGARPPVPYEARPEYMTPAIQRSRLDGLLLHLKATGHEIGDLDFYHKPPKMAVLASLERLRILGAIDEQGVITERGLKMESLPLDPEYSCMIAFAYEQGYSEKVKQHIIDIAAIMQLGGILKRAPKEQNWRELLDKDYDDNPIEKDSDFLAQLEIYSKLVKYHDRSGWGKLDIIEHNAELVELNRVSLALALGIDTLYRVADVKSNERQDVLTCINAGQLTQLWKSNGDAWSLALDSSGEFEFSDSSVVSRLGQLVTGKLFSLVTYKESRDGIQDITVVPNLPSLELSARHLTKDVVVPDSLHYSDEEERAYIRVERKLGQITLRSFERPVEGENDEELAVIRRGYADHAWNDWAERRTLAQSFTIEDIDEAIANPKQAIYGYDPITGEPLLAWMGAKGWCRSREIAIGSLEQRKARLIKAPRHQEYRELKKTLDAARGALIDLKRQRGISSEIMGQIDDLLQQKPNPDDWWQSVNRVRVALKAKPLPAVSTTKLEMAASDLIEMVIEPSSIREVAPGKFRGRLNIALNDMVLRHKERDLDTTPGSADANAIQEAFYRQIDSIPTDENDINPQNLDGLIKEPTSLSWRKNPITGEGVTVWRGYDKWYRGRDGAVRSLEIYKARLQDKQETTSSRQHQAAVSSELKSLRERRAKYEYEASHGTAAQKKVAQASIKSLDQRIAALSSEVDTTRTVAEAVQAAYRSLWQMTKLQRKRGTRSDSKSRMARQLLGEANKGEEWLARARIFIEDTRVE